MATLGAWPIDRLAVPEHLARGRRGEASQNPQQRGLARARGAQQSDDLAGSDFEIGGGNDFNAVAVRLDVELLDRARLNDRICHWMSLRASLYIFTRFLAPWDNANQLLRDIVTRLLHRAG